MCIRDSDKTEGWYWHRFFASQPDLNYDNPAVQEEMAKVLEHWADELSLIHI